MGRLNDAVESGLIENLIAKIFDVLDGTPTDMAKMALERAAARVVAQSIVHVVAQSIVHKEAPQETAASETCGE